MNRRQRKKQAAKRAAEEAAWAAMWDARLVSPDHLLEGVWLESPFRWRELLRIMS